MPLVLKLKNVRQKHSPFIILFGWIQLFLPFFSSEFGVFWNKRFNWTRANGCVTVEIDLKSDIAARKEALGDQPLTSTTALVTNDHGATPPRRAVGVLDSKETWSERNGNKRGRLLCAICEGDVTIHAHVYRRQAFVTRQEHVMLLLRAILNFESSRVSVRQFETSSKTKTSPRGFCLKQDYLYRESVAICIL